MTDTDNQRNDRLRAMIEEVHMDELRHPDPCGAAITSLLRAVDRHIREETASVETYARLGRQTNDPVVAVVMQLLVQDEAHHHSLLRRIAASLQQRLNWETAQPGALPLTGECAAEANPELVQVLRALEAEERQGSRALRDLAHYQRSGECQIVSLILEAMAMDSDKHAHLLAFLGGRYGSSSSRSSMR
jgi:hypothetical protein